MLQPALKASQPLFLDGKLFEAGLQSHQPTVKAGQPLFQGVLI